MIGPHEGRELELMLQGCKPLSVFVVESPDPDWVEFPEDEFDSEVSLGRLIKFERSRKTETPAGTPIEIRIVYYSVPQEKWRIPAIIFIEDLYTTLGPGYRPDLERVIGNLLGYDSHAIEFFIQSLREKGARFAT